MEPDWLPAVTNTPPDPSYPGAHAVVSFVGATVLTFFFERDRFDFDVTSKVLPGVERSFTKFSLAAEEASLSRIFAGVHFRFVESVGERLGRLVAHFVVDEALTPGGPESGFRLTPLRRVRFGMGTSQHPNTPVLRSRRGGRARGRCSL